MKKLLKITFAGIVLIIGLLVVVPFFISADSYKSLLAAQVKKETGRTMVMKGEASLKLFPTVSVNVADVTLSNPEGFTDAQLATIGKLSVNVALMPLLDKRIEMKGVSLDKAVIALEERADGIKNWEFSKAETTVSDAATSAPQKKSTSNIVLGNVAITNSKIIYRKAKSKPLTLDEINLTLDSAGFDSTLKATFSALYNSGKVTADVTLENVKTFLGGEATKVNIKATAPEASVTYDGTAAMAEDITANGTLDAQIADVSALSSWATGKASGGVKTLSVKGEFAAKGKTYALSDATLRADSMTATGDIATSLAGKVPSIRGKLALGSLALGGSDASAAPSSGEAAAPANSGWSNAPINLSGLRAANANVAITASDITSGKIKLGATSFHVKLNDGALSVNDINSALYGGNIVGTVNANASGAVGANITAKGIEIEPLMVAMSGKSRLAGTTNLTLNVSGSGKSQSAIISTLAGNVSFRVEDGAILGINLGKFLRDAKQGFLGSSSSERTDFAELTASATIASGILSNSDLAMKAPLLRLAGQGTVSMPPKTIDYTLMPKIAATSQGQGGKDDKAGISIPLRITGPWSNPSITPDVTAALQENLKNPEALKENLKNISEGVKDLNSKDDLKRALGKGLGGGEGEEKPNLQNILKGF